GQGRAAARALLEMGWRGPGTGGLGRLWVWGTAARRRCTSATAARNAGSEAVAVPLWISTNSWAYSGAASATVRSARPDSPTLPSLGSSVFVPTAFPISTARTTNASQPQMAILRCCALHTPARAAIPRGVFPAVKSLRFGRDAKFDLRVADGNSTLCGGSEPYIRRKHGDPFQIADDIQTYVIAYGR